MKTRLRSLLNLPEINIAIFAFLLNFVWEMLQVPFFSGMTESQHWKAAKTCSVATGGDVAVSIVAFCLVAWLAGTRNWILHPTRLQFGLFIGLGVFWSVAVEIVATKVLHRWAYSNSMPLLPGLNIGIVPIMQWILILPLVVWFVRRQLT